MAELRLTMAVLQGEIAGEKIILECEQKQTTVFDEAIAVLEEEINTAQRNAIHVRNLYERTSQDFGDAQAKLDNDYECCAGRCCHSLALAVIADEIDEVGPNDE